VEGSALAHPLLSSAAFWLVASLVVGSLANRLPPRWLEGWGAGAAAGQHPPLRSRKGRPEPPLGIRRWKRWIPDAGGALPGGVQKASLVRRDPAALRRLVLETRRAEWVHWLLWPACLLTALWLPPAGVLVNLLFATAFNGPCVVLQRYNRARLQHCLACMGEGAA
jgi:glycosyl-4,4'-diaponeurosporenoate acyltransferase